MCRPVRQRLLRSLTLLLGLVMGLAACFDSGKDATRPLPFDPVRDQFRADAINVGCVCRPDSARDAMLLAARQINDNGGVLGKPFNVVALRESNAGETPRLVGALLDAGIYLINVSTSSRLRKAMAEAIPRNGILLSDSSTAPDITTLDDDDRVFRLAPSDVYQGQLLAELALDHGASRAAVVLTADDPFGEGIAERFEANFIAGGGTQVSTVAIPADTTSGFSVWLGPMFASAPDVIINTQLSANVAANLINESIPYGFSGLYLFSDSIAGRSALINNLADPAALDGSLGVSSGFGLASNAENRFFRDIFVAQYGLAPDAFNMNAYDFAIIAALAIERAGQQNGGSEPTVLQVRDSLRAVMNPPGVKIGPSRLAEALALVRSGQDIDYSGTYADTDWDSHGDVVGQLVYDIFRLEAAQSTWVSGEQRVISSGP